MMIVALVLLGLFLAGLLGLGVYIWRQPKVDPHSKEKDPAKIEKPADPDRQKRWTAQWVTSLVSLGAVVLLLWIFPGFWWWLQSCFIPGGIIFAALLGMTFLWLPINKAIQTKSFWRPLPWLVVTWIVWMLFIMLVQAVGPSIGWHSAFQKPMYDPYGKNHYAPPETVELAEVFVTDNGDGTFTTSIPAAKEAYRLGIMLRAGEQVHVVEIEPVDFCYPVPFDEFSISTSGLVERYTEDGSPRFVNVDYAKRLMWEYADEHDSTLTLQSAFIEHRDSIWALDDSGPYGCLCVLVNGRFAYTPPTTFTPSADYRQPILMGVNQFKFLPMFRSTEGSFRVTFALVQTNPR